MLIAFAPNTALHDDRSPVRPEATSAARGGRSPRSPRALRRTSGRIFGAIAAAGWLVPVTSYLLYAEPIGASRIGPELTALVVGGGWAFVLVALAHHASGRTERLELEQRSGMLLDLLARSRSTSTARQRIPGEGESTVH